jgi:hypothetical protein
MSLPKVLIDFDKSWRLDNIYTACTKESDYGLCGGKDAWFHDLPTEIISLAKSANNKSALWGVTLKEQNGRGLACLG